MLDGWNADRLNVYALATEEYTLSPGQSVYTCGPTGDFDRPERPQRIETAFLLRGADRDELEVITDDATYARRRRDTGSGAASVLYVDGASPLANLYFNPTPAAADTVELHCWATLYGYENEEQLVELPPGYADAIAYNLALRLAPEWGKKIRDDVERGAQRGMALIQAANSPVPLLEPDVALLSIGCPGGSSYDIRTNSF